MSKYKKELKMFKEFKKIYDFKQLEIIEKDNIYVMEQLLKMKMALLGKAINGLISVIH